MVESATKAIGISELMKEQGLAACSFVRGNEVFRFATTGYSYGKSICFALLALVFDSVCRDTGSIVLCISPFNSKYDRAGRNIYYSWHDLDT